MFYHFVVLAHKGLILEAKLKRRSLTKIFLESFKVSQENSDVEVFHEKPVGITERISATAVVFEPFYQVLSEHKPIRATDIFRL